MTIYKWYHYETCGYRWRINSVKYTANPSNVLNSKLRQRNNWSRSIAESNHKRAGRYLSRHLCRIIVGFSYYSAHTWRPIKTGDVVHRERKGMRRAFRVRTRKRKWRHARLLEVFICPGYITAICVVFCERLAEIMPFDLWMSDDRSRNRRLFRF